MVWRKYVVVSVTFLLAAVSTAAAEEKTDILVMANGDKITGELKSVRQGQLSYKTDDLGTLTVNWDRVYLVLVGGRSVLTRPEPPMPPAL